MHTYPAREAHGFVYIWWGEPRSDLPPVPFFDDIDERKFRYARVRDPWATHYSRAIENRLDVVHLPLVYYNTIGRGGRTLVDGPQVKWANDDLLVVYAHNRVDDDSAPLRPEELPEPEGPFWLAFQLPNLWQNHISEQVRIVVAFVPVDDDHIILYLRFYQKLMRWPVLRDVVSRLAMPLNVYIAHQDRRVVVTERPSGQL